MEVNVEIGQRQLDEINRKCGLLTDQGKIDAAIGHAAKDALLSAKAETKRRIPEHFAIKAKRVGNTITVKKAGIAGATMRISDPSIALSYFQRSAVGESGMLKAPTVLIKRSSGPKTFKRAFAAETKSGHVGIFERKGGRMEKPYQRAEHDKWGRKTETGSGRQIKGREMIGRVGPGSGYDQFYGPGTANMFKNPEISEPVEKYAGEKLASRMDYWIGELLKNK